MSWLCSIVCLCTAACIATTAELHTLEVSLLWQWQSIQHCVKLSTISGHCKTIECMLHNRLICCLLPFGCCFMWCRSMRWRMWSVRAKAMQAHCKTTIPACKLMYRQDKARPLDRQQQLQAYQMLMPQHTKHERLLVLLQLHDVQWKGYRPPAAGTLQWNDTTMHRHLPCSTAGC